MRKFERSIRRIVTIAALPLLAIGCSLFGLDTTEAERVFYEAVKDTLPSYGNPTGRSLAAPRATWNLGSPIYELYGMLEDETTISVGYFNIYDTMLWADELFNSCRTSGTSFTAATRTAPVDVGVTGNNTYDTYYRYDSTGYRSQTFARVDGTMFYLMNVIVTSSSDQNSRAVIQGVYNEATGDVEIGVFMGNYVTEGSAWERVKAHATGNTQTHRFAVQVIRDGYAYDHNVVGAGISQGTGYFLLKLANNAMDIATNTRYYRIDAAAAVADLQALADDGYATATAAGDTEGYEASFPTAFPSTAFAAIDMAAMDVGMSTDTDDWFLAEP